MLKTMRNSFHHLKWTLFAVIAVFILGFVFWSGGSGPRRTPRARSSRRSASERITAVEFDRQYRAQVERYRQMYQGNFSPELERALDLPRNVLDSMIERMLRLEAARRMNLSVSDEELAQEDRDAALLPGEQPVHRPREVRADAPRQRHRARAFEDELREDMLLAEVRGARQGVRRRARGRDPPRVRGQERQGHDRVRPRPRQPASRARPSRPTPTSSRTSTSTRTATARRSSAASSTSWSTRPRSARR